MAFSELELKRVERTVGDLCRRRTGEWHLLWQRASVKWQGYEARPTSRDVRELVAEVDRDPYGCFFG